MILDPWSLGMGVGSTHPYFRWWGGGGAAIALKSDLKIQLSIFYFISNLRNRVPVS